MIKNLLSSLPVGITPWFYRTSAGAEIDLILEVSPNHRYAIEIKRSLTPSLSKEFYLGCEDIQAEHRFIVYPGKESYPTAHGAIVINLAEMMKKIKSL